MNAMQHAETAAEAIRALNHATLGRDGYQWPADVYAVIGSLQHLAEMLPQALAQAADWLQAAHQAGAVGHDTGADVNAAVDAVVMLLGNAYCDASGLVASLCEAHAASSHLMGVDR